MKLVKVSKPLFFSSMLMPMIPTLFLYSQNKEYLSFIQIAFLALVLSIFSILVFTVSTFFFKSSISGYSVSFVLALLIFQIRNAFSFLLFIQGYLDVQLRYIFVFLLLTICMIVYYVGIKIKRINEPTFTFFVLSITTLLLVFNIFTLLPYAFSSLNRGETKYISAFKSEFAISLSTDNPNIYWFLCDGMNGFDSIDTYFGDSSEFSTGLQIRGFQTNPYATVESAQSTMISIVALMSPHYYDVVLKDKFSSHESALAMRESAWFSSDQFHHALETNELIAAFQKKAYETHTIALSGGWYFYPTTDKFYVVTHHNAPSPEVLEAAPYIIKGKSTSNSNAQLQLLSLAKLFAGNIGESLYFQMVDTKTEQIPLTFKFDYVDRILLGSKAAYVFYKPLVESLYDSISTIHSRPRLTIIHNLMSHYPYFLDENGNDVKNTSVGSNYYSQYKYSSKVLLNMIDMILEGDPDGVIVLQADHGTAVVSEKKLDGSRVNSNDILYSTNSVLSAIRIPSKYRNGQEKFALSNPLNISRYLVNNFVGVNYEYLNYDNTSK